MSEGEPVAMRASPMTEGKYGEKCCRPKVDTIEKEAVGSVVDGRDEEGMRS